MPAEGGSAATLNGTKGLELLKVKARSIPLQEAIALHAQNVGHLEGGPSHSLSFRLNLRLTFSLLDRVSVSRGLVTICKCRCDKCKY